jgi:hypothetical protein
LHRGAPVRRRTRGPAVAKRHRERNYPARVTYLEMPIYRLVEDLRVAAGSHVGDRENVPRTGDGSTCLQRVAERGRDGNRQAKCDGGHSLQLSGAGPIRRLIEFGLKAAKDAKAEK